MFGRHEAVFFAERARAAHWRLCRRGSVKKYARQGKIDIRTFWS